MDCLCCAEGGAGPPSESEFLGSICRLDSFPDAKFPMEPGRYALYVIAGCPFAARPWVVLSFYGLAGAVVPIVKLFPAAFDGAGWFFRATSPGEAGLLAAHPGAAYDAVDPYHGDVTHLRELYERARPGFRGAVSVPLLWDTQQDTAVSNASLGLAEMAATQMRHLATRHADVALFPDRSAEPELYAAHDALVRFLHTNVTTAVYRLNGTASGREHDRLVDAYYRTLEELQERIATGGGDYLMGADLRFADLVLFISLLRLDLAYQWRFGLGRRSVRENYPGLFRYMRRILRLPGVADCVLPRDIMALYFMTPKWVEGPAGKTLPQVPEEWETHCGMGDERASSCDAAEQEDQK